MSGRVVPMSRPRRPRRMKIAIELLQVSPEQWLVACECGRSSKRATRDSARTARRRHQADHDRAMELHPAGSALPKGGGVA